MSNIISLEELKKQSLDNLEVSELRHFIGMQLALLEKYQSELKLFKEKNKQLEQILLNKSQSLIYELTPEEDICIRQIDKLQGKSNERELTLEEVKRLDLLVKNLKLIREESTIVVNNKGRSESMTEAELVAIARTSQTDESNQSS